MRYRSIQIWLIGVIIALFSPEATFGRSVMPTLEMLTNSASLIVVAEVENVTEKGGVKIATARVIDVWKGQQVDFVQFRASGSWKCDASTAIPGETVVLFLVADAQTEVTAIAYSGIGRLPVVNARSVNLYSGLFTKAIKQEVGVSQESFSGHVNLSILKKHVLQLTQRRLPTRSLRSIKR